MSKSKARSLDTELGAGGGAAGEPETPTKKQKTVANNDSDKPGRFKVAAHLVMAMKRFQAALNPTIGPPAKRIQDTPDRLANERTKVQVQPKNASGRAASGQTRSSSGRTLSGRPIGPPGQQHGHKGNILLRPLPVVEN
jgi:hypothetical protein